MIEWIKGLFKKQEAEDGELLSPPPGRKGVVVAADITSTRGPRVLVYSGMIGVSNSTAISISLEPDVVGMNGADLNPIEIEHYKEWVLMNFDSLLRISAKSTNVKP